MKKNHLAITLAITVMTTNVVSLPVFANEAVKNEITVESKEETEASDESKETEETEKDTDITEEETDSETEESSEDTTEKSTEDNKESESSNETVEDKTEETEKETKEEDKELKENKKLNKRKIRAANDADKTQGSQIKLKVASGSEIDPGDPDNPDNPDNPPPDPETFSVTVPAVVTVSMDLVGKVTVADNLKITNGNDSAIKCVDIDLVLEGDWQAADFDSSSSNIDDKNFSIAFRGDKLKADGKITVTEDNWNFGANDSLPLNTKVRIPKQSTEYETDLATVNWTFDWSTNNTSSNPDTGKDIPNNPEIKETYKVSFIVPEDATIKGDKVVEVAAGTTLSLPEVELYGIREEVNSWKDEVDNVIAGSTITVDKDKTLTAVVDTRAENPKNWFTASDNVLTGLSTEYLNMIDAPTDLVIPNNVGGLTITSIGPNAFKNKDLITSVVIPNTVTEIDATAFTGCNANITIDVKYSSLYGIANSPWGLTEESGIIWE